MSATFDAIPTLLERLIAEQVAIRQALETVMRGWNNPSTAAVATEYVKQRAVIAEPDLPAVDVIQVTDEPVVPETPKKVKGKYPTKLTDAEAYDMAKVLIGKIIAERGRDTAVELLATFDVKKLPELNASLLPGFIDAANEVLG